MNHQILLATLAELDIAESALSWFTSYLTNRTHQVTLSKPCTLDTGVPQGSALGLLLFRPLYQISGLCNHTAFHCYSDDTQLFPSFPSSYITQLATRISECLADVGTWRLPIP